MLELLKAAAKVAMPSDNSDIRSYFLGCIGIRKDGTIVHSRNGAVHSTSIDNYQLIPDAHAECRTIKKMDRGGILYVARVRRKDKCLAMSMPCAICRIKIKAKGIKKVYFTIDENYYGLWLVDKNQFKIFEG